MHAFGRCNDGVGHCGRINYYYYSLLLHFDSMISLQRVCGSKQTIVLVSAEYHSFCATRSFGVAHLALAAVYYWLVADVL